MRKTYGSRATDLLSFDSLKTESCASASFELQFSITVGACAALKRPCLSDKQLSLAGGRFGLLGGVTGGGRVVREHLCAMSTGDMIIRDDA